MRYGFVRLPFNVSHLHDPQLDGVDLVEVVAHDPAEGRPPDLLQLGRREARPEAAVLVPEPVAAPQVHELLRQYARERRADQPADDGALCQSTSEQVYVSHVSVERRRRY